LEQDEEGKMLQAKTGGFNNINSMRYRMRKKQGVLSGRHKQMGPEGSKEEEFEPGKKLKFNSREHGRGR